MVSSNALKHMIKHYADPQVGGVSGAKGIIVNQKDTAASEGEGLYWKYESMIKNADSNFNSLMIYLSSKNISSYVIGGVDETDLSKLIPENEFIHNLINKCSISDTNPE